MDFPAGNLPLPERQFPFHARAVPLPLHGTRLPLSPHCNPLLTKNDCLGDFRLEKHRLLSSFADTVSREYRLFPWPWISAHSFSFPTQPRKAGYTAHSTVTVPHCRFISCLVRSPGSRGPCGCRTITGLRGNRVVTFMPLRPPDNLNPQHPPETGRNKQAPGTSSICPLKDF